MWLDYKKGKRQTKTRRPGTLNNSENLKGYRKFRARNYNPTYNGNKALPRYQDVLAVINRVR